MDFLLCKYKELFDPQLPTLYNLFSEVTPKMALNFANMKIKGVISFSRSLCPPCFAVLYQTKPTVSLIIPSIPLLFPAERNPEWQCY